MKYISLFSGIGGFDLGFDRAGMECVLQVEKDDKARAVLAHHWPNVPRMELVEDVTRDSVRETIDLLCGGFPCQDLSVAGQRKGLAGERSGLWFEFLRVIEEFRPGWIVIENVPGLLSSNSGRDMGTILNGLGQCGYWWAYRVLDSQYYRVPQRRRRVFIVASLRKFAPQEILFERESSPWDTPPSREAGPGFAAAITKRTREAGRTLELQEDLAYALTNPGSGGWPHSRLIAWDNGQGDPNGDESGLSYALNGQANQGVAFGGNNTGPIAYKRRGGFGWSETENLSPTLESEGGTHQGGPEKIPYVAFGGNNTSGAIDVACALNAHGSRRYDFESEIFIANAFNGYTGGADDNDAQGNHQVVSLVEGFDQSRGQYTGDIAAPLTLNGAVKPGVNDGKPDNMCISGAAGVRRLTPLECERLQGFPDGHTDIGQSDSARYRQLGNAVTVLVIEWIGKRIKNYTRGQL